MLSYVTLYRETSKVYRLFVTAIFLSNNAGSTISLPFPVASGAESRSAGKLGQS